MMEKPNLQLSPVTLTDSEAIFLAIEENRQSLRVWLPFVDYSISEEDTILFIKSTMHTGEKVFVIRYENSFAGLIGLKCMDKANKKIEIGYWLIPACEGKGLITNACRELIEYAFVVLEMNRILIQVGVENTKSRRIPERLGFKEEGIERQGELLVNGYTDIVRYGLLKSEYNANN